MSSEPATVGAGRSPGYFFEQLEQPAHATVSPRELLASAWEEAEQIRQQARADGEAEGRAAGLAASQAEVQSTVSALAAALGEVDRMRAELAAALERDAAELAVRLAEQILAGALEISPEIVIDVARNALRRVTDRRSVVLISNPADLELLRAAVPDFQAELGGIESCDVQSDRRVQRGGVILRTEAGEIDTTIDAQFERAREIVAEALKGKPDGS